MTFSNLSRIIVLLTVGCRFVVTIPTRSYNSRQASATRCVSSVFSDLLAANNAALETGSPYTPQDEPYPDDLKVLAHSGMPEACGIRVNVTPSDSSNTFAFELYLPPPGQWNRRLLTVGNGGFNGGTSRHDMFSRLVHNWATMSTNTGHEAPLQSWAVNITNGSNVNGVDKQKDWAWRSMNGSVALARDMVELYYQISIDYSYYSGCSTGGRQGLKQIQLAPDSFDGLLLGAPAWDTKNLMPWVAKLGSYTSQLSDLTTNFTALYQNIAAVCNQTFHYPDNIISSPQACLALFLANDSRWDVIRCKSGQDPTTCVNGTQLTIIKDMLNTTTFPDTHDTFSGYDISALPLFGSFLNRGGDDGFDNDFAKYFLGNGTDTPLTWSKNGDVLAGETAKWDQHIGATADKFSLDGFRGKIIVYQGLADQLIPSGSSRKYVEKTRELDPRYANWLRYFEIEGMRHCVNSDSLVNDVPWYIGGVGLRLVNTSNPVVLAVPDSSSLTTAKNDALVALTEWVEQGRAPTRIDATAFLPGTFDQPPGGSLAFQVAWQRPICASPKKPYFDLTKNGTYRDLSLWSCINPDTPLRVNMDGEQKVMSGDALVR